MKRKFLPILVAVVLLVGGLLAYYLLPDSVPSQNNGVVADITGFTIDPLEFSRMQDENTRSIRRCTVELASFVDESKIFTYTTGIDEQRQFVIWGDREPCAISVYIDDRTLNLYRESDEYREDINFNIYRLLKVALRMNLGENSMNECETCRYNLLRFNP